MAFGQYVKKSGGNKPVYDAAGKARVPGGGQSVQGAGKANGSVVSQPTPQSGGAGAVGLARANPVGSVGTQHGMAQPNMGGGYGSGPIASNPNPGGTGFNPALDSAGGGGWLGDIAAGDVAQDPTLMLRAMMNGQVQGAGGGISPTGFAALSPLGNVMNAFYLLSNPGYQNGNNANFMNFAQQFWNNAQSGHYFDAQGLWNSLNNPTGFLSDYLGGGGTEVDPFTQAQNYKQLATAIAGATMNPLMAQAYMNHINSQLGNFELGAARTNTAPNMGNVTSFLNGLG